MGIIEKIFGKKTGKTISAPEHAVIVSFTYGSTDLSSLFALEEQLEEVIVKTGVGEYDGNEVATDGGDGILYMYGPNADALFAAVRPTLEAMEFMKKAHVKLRYGPRQAGIRESEIVINP